MTFLKAFIPHPKICGDFKEKEEEVILLIRAHPFTQIYWFLNGIFIFFILLAINYVFFPYLDLSQKLFINVFVVVIIFSYWWFNFLSWYFNVGIVTNKRIIDIDFYGLIYKEITSAKLEKIEDITVKSGGFFASIFNYGNIFIQTAGTQVNIEFFNVPSPNKVRALINSLTTEKQ
jgi:membrane protein YdbS with pleckstrin-like domain